MGLKRAYWTKGIITDAGLMYCPLSVHSPAVPTERRKTLTYVHCRMETRMVLQSTTCQGRHGTCSHIFHLHLAWQTFDARKPAFAPLKEPHLRPKAHSPRLLCCGAVYCVTWWRCRKLSARRSAFELRTGSALSRVASTTVSPALPRHVAHCASAVVLPGPGLYVRPFEAAKRSVGQNMMAVANGAITPSSAHH